MIRLWFGQYGHGGFDDSLAPAVGHNAYSCVSIAAEKGVWYVMGVWYERKAGPAAVTR